MSRPSAFFVELKNSEASFTYARWQSRWIEQVVTWEGQQWFYQRMRVTGVMSGQSLGAQAEIQIPLTDIAHNLMNILQYPPGIAIIRKYHMNANYTTVAPHPTQVVVAETVGQIVQVSRTMSEISIAIGSSLTPVGASFVPRRYTTRLIGLPLIL
jgi:hypothetical protein